MRTANFWKEYPLHSSPGIGLHFDPLNARTHHAMIEKMEGVPCGAKERGLTGLGSVFASVGATRVDSDEKLCPQYMLRTDDNGIPCSSARPQASCDPAGRQRRRSQNLQRRHGNAHPGRRSQEAPLPGGRHETHRPLRHLGCRHARQVCPHKDRDYADKPPDARSNHQKTIVKNPTDPASPPQ